MRRWLADLQGSRVDEGHAPAPAFSTLQIGAQRDERRGHQCHEAVVAPQAREGPRPVLEHVSGVIALEVAVSCDVAAGADRQHFRQAEGRSPLPLARLKQALLPERFKEQAAVVYVAEQG